MHFSELDDIYNLVLPMSENRCKQGPECLVCFWDLIFFPFEELFWIHPICRLTRQQFSLHTSKQHVYSSPSSAAAAAAVALRLDFLAVKTVLSFSHRRAAVASPRFHPPRSRFEGSGV